MKSINIFVATVFFIGTAIADDTGIKERFLQLSAEEQHLRVSEQLANHVWTSSSDPELLITYCASRFISNPKDSTCRLNPASDQQAHEFSDMLWKIWSGNTTTARSRLGKLASDATWKPWGEIGRLELSLYVQNHRELNSLLKRLEKSALRKNKRFDRMLLLYKISHAEETHEWSKLKELLHQHRQELAVTDLRLFTAQARLYFVDGMRNDLAVLLKSASPQIQRTTDYIFYKAEYLVLTKGVNESKDLIRKSSAEHQGRQKLFLQSQYIALVDGSPNVAAAASNELFKIAQSSSNQVRLILDLAVTMASYHKPDEARRIIGLIDVGDGSLPDFASFHVFMAWDAIYRGDTMPAKSMLRQALAMAPNHVAANWLKVLIAKKENDQKSGAEALSVLFQADPYNLNYANLIRHFSNKFNTPALRLLAKQLANKSVPESNIR